MRISYWSSDVCSSDLTSPGGSCGPRVNWSAWCSSRPCSCSGSAPPSRRRSRWTGAWTVRSREPPRRDARRTASIEPVTNTTPLQILVYSDDVDTRQQVILALGRRPHPELPEFEYVEVATEPVVLQRSEEHTSELQSLMRISYAVFCLKQKTK